MKIKICKMIVGFFLVMLVFTILSRKLNEISKAAVEVGSISSGMLDYSIEARGTVINSESVPVCTIENQLIETIRVNVNQKVVQGEELFSVNEQKLALQKQEIMNQIEELRLQIADAQRAREAAGAMASDSQKEILSLELGEKQKELAELEELSAAGGKIYASCDGIITEISGKAGEITSGGSVLLMTESLFGDSAVVPITEEQREKIKEGDVCRVEGYDENNHIKTLEEAEIVSIQRDSENENYEAVVNLQGENFLCNSSVDFYMEIKSQPYSCCIPISALRVDADGNYYVLVVESRETILGEELTAKKIIVEVIEKSATTVAIEEGVLDNRQKIIVNSSKSIENGSFVKQSERSTDEE